MEADVPRDSPLKGLLSMRVGTLDSKYNPLPALFDTRPRVRGEARQDLVGAFLQQANSSRGDRRVRKYDPLPGLLARLRSAPAKERPDPIGKLLRADPPHGEAMFDPLPDLWALDAASRLRNAPDAAVRPAKVRFLDISWLGMTMPYPLVVQKHRLRLIALKARNDFP